MNSRRFLLVKGWKILCRLVIAIGGVVDVFVEGGLAVGALADRELGTQVVGGGGGQGEEGEDGFLLCGVGSVGGMMVREMALVGEWGVLGSVHYSP